MRRLKRDIAERGRDLDEVLERYQTTLKPMHQQFALAILAHCLLYRALIDLINRSKYLF